jgi:hypothetical protein
MSDLLTQLFPTRIRDVADDAAWGNAVPVAYRHPDDPEPNGAAVEAVIGTRWVLREPRGDALDSVTVTGVDAAEGELIFQTADFEGIEDPTTPKRPSYRGVADGEPAKIVRGRRNTFSLPPEDFETFYRRADGAESEAAVEAARVTVARLDNLLMRLEADHV